MIAEKIVEAFLSLIPFSYLSYYRSRGMSRLLVFGNCQRAAVLSFHNQKVLVQIPAVWNLYVLLRHVWVFSVHYDVNVSMQPQI